MFALFQNTNEKLSPLAGIVTDIHVSRSVADNTHCSPVNSALISRKTSMELFDVTSINAVKAL